MSYTAHPSYTNRASIRPSNSTLTHQEQLESTPLRGRVGRATSNSGWTGGSRLQLLMQQTMNLNTINGRFSKTADGKNSCQAGVATLGRPTVGGCMNMKLRAAGEV